MTKASSEQTHRGYIIRTMVIGKMVKARAFTGAKAVLDAEAASVDAVTRMMRDRLDARDAAYRAKRHGPIPTVEEFVDALNRVSDKINAPQLKMLRALYEAPDRMLNATELAAAAGYARYLSANEKFGKLARMVAEDLAYDPEPRADGAVSWASTLATDDDQGDAADAAHWRWKMRPEVADAIGKLGLFASRAA